MQKCIAVIEKCIAEIPTIDFTNDFISVAVADAVADAVAVADVAVAVAVAGDETMLQPGMASG